MNITIVGAGPAGIWASILLARQGHTPVLIDPQAPWEKPCGGGVTAKALASFGIFDSDLPRQVIDRITVYFGDKTSVTLSPQQPIAVVSRRELGRCLLEEAQKLGVTFIPSRVTKVARTGRQWLLSTREGD